MDIQKEYFKTLKSKIKQKKHTAFRASSAGSCILKQMFYINNIEEKRDFKKEELITLRFGTIIHLDIQESLKEKGLVFEFPIVLPELNVIGHIDAIEIQDKKVIIYDFKTIKAYAYRRLFGLKKNRDKNPSEKYYLQIGTYALAIKKLFPNKEIEMHIIYIKKDDARFKDVLVDNIYIQKAYDYWETVNDFWKRNKDKIELKMGNMYCPIETWECNYCNYRYKCIGEENEKS